MEINPIITMPLVEYTLNILKAASGTGKNEDLVKYRSRLMEETSSNKIEMEKKYGTPSAEKINEYYFIIENIQKFKANTVTVDQYKNIYKEFTKKLGEAARSSSGTRTSETIAAARITIVNNLVSSAALETRNTENTRANSSANSSAASSVTTPKTMAAETVKEAERAGVKKQNPSREVEYKSKLVPVYPDTFSNFDHPTTPVVSIQFRSKYSPSASELTKDETWTDITLMDRENYQNKFFVGMELEDTGVKRVTLTLRDKYCTTLENIIMTSLFMTTLSEKFQQNERVNGSSSEDPDEKTLFTFILNRASLVNLRLRFGYSLSGNIKIDDYIYDKNGGKDYSERVMGKGHLPVLQTPWLYFQILNIKQSLGDDGLTFTINATSSVTSFLTKTKLLRKFSTITGTPENIINSLRNVMKIASGGKSGSGIAEIAEWEGPIASEKPVHTSVIELDSGPQPKVDKDGKPIEEFRTIEDLYNELCSKIKPLKIGEDGTSKKETEEGEDTSSERFSRYSYYVDETTEDSSKIVFKYDRPDTFFKIDGAKIRTYFWREYPKTVIKSLNISTETDFAQMNMPIVEKSNEGTSRVLINGNTYIAGTMGEVPAGNIIDMGSLNSNKLDFSFIGNGGISPQQNAEGATSFFSSIRSKFLKSINSSIFRGTVELDGDPFYLFDSNVQPNNYLIKIIVMRPSESPVTYKDSDEANNISYLSGFYYLKSIKHNISESGFSTTLEVSKWPTLFTVDTPPPKINDPARRNTGQNNVR